MKKNNDFLDNFAKLAESGFSSAVNVKNEMTNIIRNQVDAILNKLNFVKQEEFIALKKICLENQKQIKSMKNQDAKSKNAKSKNASTTSTKKVVQK